MPTQEELNAAQVELDIANDNYAALADRYNRYQKLFQEYANSSPEIKERATEAMWRALEDYYQLQDKMRAAEDRIAVAQNTVNSYNELLAQQPVTQPANRWGGRRVNPNNYFWWNWWTNNWGTLTSPDWQTIIYPDGSIQFWVDQTVNDNQFQVREWWNPVYNNKWEIVWEQRISTPSFQVREWWKPVYNNKWEIVWEQKVSAPTLNSIGSYPNSRFRNTISWVLPYWTNWVLNWTLKYWGSRRTLNTPLSWYQAPTPTYTGWYRNLNTWWPEYKWTLNQ